MQDPDYFMKIMASWMTLDELEGSRTGRYFVESSGTKQTKQFTYCKPFGIHFRYIHQMDDQNNWRHGKISLKRKWATKFWTDHDFVRYLTVFEVNTALALGPFKNDGLVQPSLGFWTALAMECLENKIGFELGDNK